MKSIEAIYYIDFLFSFSASLIKYFFYYMPNKLTYILALLVLNRTLFANLRILTIITGLLVCKNVFYVTKICLIEKLL